MAPSKKDAAAKDDAFHFPALHRPAPPPPIKRRLSDEDANRKLAAAAPSRFPSTAQAEACLQILESQQAGDFASSGGRDKAEAFAVTSDPSTFNRASLVVLDRVIKLFSEHSIPDSLDYRQAVAADPAMVAVKDFKVTSGGANSSNYPVYGIIKRNVIGPSTARAPLAPGFDTHMTSSEFATYLEHEAKNGKRFVIMRLTGTFRMKAPLPSYLYLPFAMEVRAPSTLSHDNEGNKDHTLYARVTLRRKYAPRVTYAFEAKLFGSLPDIFAVAEFDAVMKGPLRISGATRMMKQNAAPETQKLRELAVEVFGATDPKKFNKMSKFSTTT